MDMTTMEFIDGDGSSFSGALRALWFAGRGEWEQAHEIAQAEDNRDGAWVHAYLHRVEGDTNNANYWYRARQAGRHKPAISERNGSPSRVNCSSPRINKALFALVSLCPLS